MQIKVKSLDQITAWVAGIILGSICLGLFYWSSQRAASRAEAEKEKLAQSAAKMLAESMTGLKTVKTAPAVDTLNTKSVASSAKKSDDLTYAYSGSLAPWRWMDLRPEWSICGLGRKQSPVDISGARENPRLKPIKLHYQHGATQFSLANSTLHGEIEAGSWIDLDGDRYDLKSVDFRTPGEHRINGLPYELELQLRHEELSGRRLYLSVQFTNGKPNSELKRVVEKLPRFEGETSSIERLLWLAFMPTKKTYWYYRGSLTHPPCSEDITWVILTSTVTASPLDIEAIAKLQHDNARPAQPLNGRHIVRSNR